MSERLMSPALSKAVGWDAREVTYPSSIPVVNAAPSYRLLEWHRFLPSPTNDEQTALIKRILERLYGLKEIDDIAKVPVETRRYIELLEKVLETGKLWIESRNLPAHDSLGTHILQRVDVISDLRRDFETAISEAVEERPSDGEENS